VAVLVARGLYPARSASTPSPPSAARAAEPAAAFVGEAACASCHAREAALWGGSHHQRAMQPASAATVLGDFRGARFDHAGVSSSFFRREGRFVARTDGPDGALRDYPVTHTFGVAPLQQYLVALPGGRLQALEVAWDSRPRGEGGQRWFHIYDGERIAPGDPLHWTGRAERWNSMCADCHSTDVRKGWDAASGGYDTRYASISVGCEACHGPGARHVAWARGGGAPSGEGERRGLSIALDERASVAWERDARGLPRRSRPRDTAREIEMCARCHARRGLVHEDHVHGQPLGDDYRVALLDGDLYWPDGQVRGEVYEYGSFVQSRMFAEGVTCSDCHDPHRPDLRAAGDAPCLRCHDARYASARHHFHRAGSTGARCVACHMPTTTFMGVDARHDHSLRVPRPALSVALGVPNPCTGCHRGRAPAWAARTVEKWYGHPPLGHQRFAEALAAGAEGAPGATARLAALSADRGQPAIARASALERLERPAAPSALALLRGTLADPDPLVRRAAVRLFSRLDPRARTPLLAPLAADPVRTVRMEAAAALAAVPLPSLPADDAAALARATDELVASHELNGDLPEAHLDLALLHAEKRRFDRAEAELARALAFDPGFAPAAVNLADLYRALGRDAEGGPVLRRALEHAPESPPLLHALGLWLVRQKRAREALAPLGAAARLDGDSPRYGYVFAVALEDTGSPAEATRVLVQLLARHPFDHDALAALLALRCDAGDRAGAARLAERLRALEPDRR
jgi:tetratricopeptide (TPR) repeat protein